MATTPTGTAPSAPAADPDLLQEMLCAWFVARDDLYDAEAGPDRHDHALLLIAQQAVIDMADELVAILVPDRQARCALTGECPSDFEATPARGPALGGTVSCIEPGIGRIIGHVVGRDAAAVSIQWRHTSTPPSSYPHHQLVPTLQGWHIRRS